MSISKRDDPKFLRAYDRGMLRSTFHSLFWAIISDRKKRGTYTLLQLAKAIGANKAEVTRWFKGDPNWTLNTVASIASALDVELEVRARDRATGTVFTPAGAVSDVPALAIAIRDQIGPTPTRSSGQPSAEVGAFTAAQAAQATQTETRPQMSLHSNPFSPLPSRIAA
jgi:hypothetical protein